LETRRHGRNRVDSIQIQRHFASQSCLDFLHWLLTRLNPNNFMTHQ
jgi:hypothetical protein